jgi:hypothetical protein
VKSSVFDSTRPPIVHHLTKTTPNTTDSSNQKSAVAFSPPFSFAPTSKGLPPPPKASGLLFAALVRWAWLVRVVAWPLLKAVERKVAVEGGFEVEDWDEVEVELDVEEDAELAEDVDSTTVDVR